MFEFIISKTSITRTERNTAYGTLGRIIVYRHLGNLFGLFAL